MMSQRSIRAYEVKKFTKKSCLIGLKIQNSDFKIRFYKIYIDYPRDEVT